MTAQGVLFALATALSMTAAPQAQSPAAPTPFSPAGAAGDFVYLSGVLPTDASGEIVAGDVRMQTARALDTPGALLEKNGSSLARVEIMMTAVKSPSPQGAAVAKTAAAGGGDWRPLFDGKTLTGWKESQFTGRGKVSIEDGQVVLGNGYMTGITWTGAFPTSNFEVRYQAQRRSGSDFFGALTFPVHDSYCTFINGGWGGSVVGLSSLDTMDASENDTTVTMGFTNGRWYSFRVRVTDGSIEAWIDEERVVAVDIRGRRIGLRPGGIEYSAPLGIASYESVAAIRNIEYRVIDPTGNAKR